MEQKPEIKLHLSRTVYPLETSVIGTVSIPNSNEIASIQLYVAGRCRLDARWHDVQTIKSKYNTHPCHDNLPLLVEKMVEDSYFHKKHHQDSSICFWSTNVITLYDDATHQYNHHDPNHTQTQHLCVPLVHNGDPETNNETNKPLEMSGSDWFQQGLEIMEAMRHYDSNHWNDDDSKSNDDSSMSDSSSDSTNDSNQHRREPIRQCHHSLNDLILQDEEQIHDDDLHVTQESNLELSKEESNPLFFTFRADIPKDIPPTVNAVSGRIFYSAVVHVVTKGDGKSIVIQAPFTIIASSNIDSYKKLVSKTKISIGAVDAVSHTKPYLIPLSSTYKSEPWSLSVKRQHCRPNNIKTISVGDHDQKCCSLTIIGGGVIVPGECIHFQFSFPYHQNPMGHDVLPCYQVSACLYGNEYVIENDGTRKKSRTYSFDTDHLNVIPGVTTSVSLRLRLPQDCPISVSTDFFAIQCACRIDLTVKGSNDHNFRFLTVEFPCQVNQDGPTFEPMENDLPPDLENRLFALKWSDKSSESKVLKRIVSSEVFNDLRILSLLSMNE